MSEGITWLSGSLRLGPPRTWIMFVRFRAYERACRTWTLDSALLLLGETVLNTMYGFEDAEGPMVRFGSFLAMSAGSCEGGGKLSNSMSALGVPVCSCCCVESCVTVSLTTILSTYALRTGSDAASQ